VEGESASVTDPTAQAFQIVGALHSAGLLQNTGVTSSADLVAAFRAAGLLQAPAPPPPPLAAPAGPKIGDTIYVAVDHVEKLTLAASLTAAPSVTVCRFTEGTKFYIVDFPPNNVAWQTEIEKIIAAPKPLDIIASVLITGVDPNNSEYIVRLNSLTVGAWCVSHY
jgi:hypothetical protein